MLSCVSLPIWWYKLWVVTCVVIEIENTWKCWLSTHNWRSRQELLKEALSVGSIWHTGKRQTLLCALSPRKHHQLEHVARFAFFLNVKYFLQTMLSEAAPRLSLQLWVDNQHFQVFTISRTTRYYSQFILPDRPANITKIILRHTLLILFIPNFWSRFCLKCTSVYSKTHVVSVRRDGPSCPLWWQNIWWREGRHCDRNAQCQETSTVCTRKATNENHLMDNQPVEEIRLHDFVLEQS